MTPTILSTVAGNFAQSMLMLVQGMTGIFVFMGLFYLVIHGLERLFKDKKGS